MKFKNVYLFNMLNYTIIIVKYLIVDIERFSNTAFSSTLARHIEC